MDQPCTGDIDPVTLEPYTDTPPNIKIYFYPNPGEVQDRYYVLCTQKESLREWLSQDDNEMSVWVPNAGRTIDDNGYGGLPSVEKVYKLYGDVTYFSATKDFFEDDVLEYAAIPVYSQPQRIGTAFGVSALHGQAPGFRIYYIAPLKDISVALLKSVIRYYASVKGKSVYLRTGNKDQYIEFLQWFNDNNSSPLEDPSLRRSVGLPTVIQPLPSLQSTSQVSRDPLTLLRHIITHNVQNNTQNIMARITQVFTSNGIREPIMNTSGFSTLNNMLMIVRVYCLLTNNANISEMRYIITSIPELVAVANSHGFGVDVSSSQLKYIIDMAFTRYDQNVTDDIKRMLVEEYTYMRDKFRLLRRPVSEGEVPDLSTISIPDLSSVPPQPVVERTPVERRFVSKIKEALDAGSRIQGDSEPFDRHSDDLDDRIEELLNLNAFYMTAPTHDVYSFWIQFGTYNGENIRVRVVDVKAYFAHDDDTIKQLFIQKLKEALDVGSFVMSRNDAPYMINRRTSNIDEKLNNLYNATTFDIAIPQEHTLRYWAQFGTVNHETVKVNVANVKSYLRSGLTGALPQL